MILFSMGRPAYRRALPCLGLCCILVVYAICVARLKPANFFGLSEDDSIYFSSARALAEGHGYILPSVPGTPPGTKYPVLYPWLLSWIWRWNPSFPANLTGALALNVGFGFGFLSAAFLFFRKIARFKDMESLVLTALCGLDPLTLFYSANLMTEIPFAALALGAIVWAGESLRKDHGTACAMFSGVLTGLSTLIRVLGLPLAAGLFLAILLRGSWRKLIGFAACVIPFLGVFVLRSIVVTPTAAPITASSCSPVWNMTWMYYTSYLDFWRVDVIQDHLIWHTLKDNFVRLILQPGKYFFDPRFVGLRTLPFVLPGILSAGAIRGYYRQIRAEGWGPVPYALTFYCMAIVLWDYPEFERFFMPFLPLMAAGLWIEGRYLMKRIGLALRDGSVNAERPAAIFLSAAVVVMFLNISWFFWRGAISIRRASELRSTMLQEKREAYSWLRENSSTDSRVIAYDDASLFLYSGRQAMQPVIFAPAGIMRAELLNADLRCIVEGARVLRASYWLISDDDFYREWEPASSRGRTREREIENVLPEVFRSANEHVRIYALGCARHLDEPACRPVSSTLFPSADGNP